MKLQALAALAALPLLAGCGGSPSTDPSPAAVHKAVAVEQAAAPAAQAIPENAGPMVLDLTRQMLTVPGTAYGSLEIPILAAGDVRAGTSETTATPEDGGYSHCDDTIAGWGTEPAPENGYGLMLQFITFDTGCWQIPFTGGHPVVVPRQVSVQGGPTFGTDQLLTAGRGISVIGESPYPEPNLFTLGAAALGKIQVTWPSDTETVVPAPAPATKSDQIEARKAAVTVAAAQAAEAFVARQTTKP